MSGSIEGLSETFAAFDRLGSSGKRESTKALQKSIQKVRSDWIKSIQRGAKSGRVYVRGNGQNLSSTHQASAPGEAPATDTGRTVASIKATVTGQKAKAYSDLDSLFYLEYGTMTIAPRPSAVPALMNNEAFIIDAFNKGLEAAMREFNK